MLLSPMVAVNPAARVGRLLGALSIVPGLEQSGWHEILPEYLPFKYTSFPLHAARESARLTDALARSFARAEAAGRLGELPPVLAFQSFADSTVSTQAVAHRLFSRLPGAHHELVIFDLNRASDLRPFLYPTGDENLARLGVATAGGARLTLVTNASPRTAAVVERRDGRADRPLGLAWPDGVYSLSHVALPFPPDDALYGLRGARPPPRRPRAARREAGARRSHRAAHASDVEPVLPLPRRAARRLGGDGRAHPALTVAAGLRARRRSNP